MDFFANQWVPARRAFQPERRTFRPEHQYEATEPERRSFRPRFQNNAPGMSEFQPVYEAAPAPDLRRSPKVVQIPVLFAGDEETRSASALKTRTGDEETRSASALKIQKVLRGYLVRKSVRKIIGIKREVDAIEARVSKKEVLDLIREKDGKERLKVNESLMALLFKLDAVSGCSDSGIRLCRKAVIRKAIALQEKVDTLADDPEVDEKLEVEEDPRENELKSTDSDLILEELMPNSASNDDEKYEENVAAVADVGDDDASGAKLKGDIDSVMVEDEKEIGVVSEKPVGSGGDRDLVLRVVEQNGKMMKMMAELFEKNEAQAKMLSGLTHRLEQLEKAYVCDKIDKIRRRKKKLST